MYVFLCMTYINKQLHRRQDFQNGNLRVLKIFPRKIILLLEITKNDHLKSMRNCPKSIEQMKKHSHAPAAKSQ